jgi:chaperonin GroES
MASFKPLGDRVAVERIEEKTTSGIIIPDTAKEKPIQGKIVAIGQGARDESGKRIPMDVKEGDIVLFTKWGGTEFKIDGKEVTILKESDILAVLDKKSSAKAA